MIKHVDSKGALYAITTTSRGLSTQMKKLELISENIANVEKGPDENGKLYQRQFLDFKETSKLRHPRFADELSLSMRRSRTSHMPEEGINKRGDLEKEPFEVKEQEGEMLVFDPNHPRADENGYVRMPNVNMIEEMTDLLGASRVYEANVTIINAAKSMAKRSLEI